MADNTPAERPAFFDDLASFYEQAPVTFPGVDIFCWRSSDPGQRLAALITVLCMMRDQTKRFPISRITVVWPASSSGPPDAIESRLHGSVLNVMAQLSKQKLPRSQTRFLAQLLHVVRCATLEVVTASQLIQESQQLSVIIFVDSAKYRDNALPVDAPSGPAPRFPEDLWVHHLRSFAERAVAAAAARGCYVVLDAGEYSPLKPENAEILRSVDGCGVLGSHVVDDPRAIAATNLERWSQQVQAGLLGPAFSEIDALPSSLDPEKRILKIQLLSQAGLPAQLLDLLREEQVEIANTDPEILVRFSRFAWTAGDIDLASSFLVHAVRGLDSQEELELALMVSFDIGNSTVEDTCLGRLQALFPRSHQLHRHRAARLIDSRKYREAALVAGDPIAGFSDELRDFHLEMASGLETEAQPDYESILVLVRKRWPSLLERGLLICAADARARNLSGEALRLLLTVMPIEYISERLARSFLHSLEQALLAPIANPDASRDGLLRKALLELIRYLSRNPDDGRTRGGLFTVLSPSISGTRGLFLLATIVLELAERDFATYTDTTQRPPPIDLEDVRKSVEPVLEWLSRQSPVAIGRAMLPVDLLTVPADRLVEPLERLIQSDAIRVATETDRIAFEKILFAAILIARHSSIPDEDLHLLQRGAGKLALGGRLQRARDLAEEALQTAGETRRRAHTAWYVFADIYQRVQNPAEALLAMACALASRSEITTEQAWYETYLLIRLLRDLGLVPTATSLLPLARSLVQELGPAGEFEHRFVTLELSLRLLELGEKSRKDDLERFLFDAKELCLTVLKRNDEMAPAATLLAQGVYLCRRRGLPISVDALETLDSALASIPTPLASLIQTLSAEEPTSTDVLALVRRLEPARYAGDTSLDLRHVVTAARRLLDDTQADDPFTTAMAIELLSDHAFTRQVDVTPSDDALHGLPASVQEAGEFAQKYSVLGIRLVLLGLSSSGGLVRVTADKGILAPVVRESPSVFSNEELKQWVERFPYEYASVRDADNLFYTSMRFLGLTIEPTQPTLFITDTFLAKIPPSLFLVCGELLGRTIPVAAAPSLAWLKSIVEYRRTPSGRKRAWISKATREENHSTLSMVAERLEPTLRSYSIELDTNPTLPSDFSGSDMVVIAAHGGMVSGGQFFQSVSDDADLRASSSDVSKALRGVELVILFVCSGGRVDTHPLANTTVGLVRDLLNHGCRTVIAPSWPLDARVPSHWLPEFLARWASGFSAITANFHANRVVDKAMGDSPTRCLAMTVLGDPLLTKR